ncbi:hypothetical protein G1K66_12520 [Tenacibaculum finnmarkense]|uniref:hypothetical protein n=1 Tax=Tenacibaculum finnmarkense TaxID=2781243 RepID=UPI001E39197D|nr:hypothetical protein [Tenacibaculum finnmarkense]MCD8445366.1 hypothetical protein [Tenacibaculum finnmarkense genomovar ulcerans]MCG8814081.1 hypothetical protein [Tenacibaculum finnmarkense]
MERIVFYSKEDGATSHNLIKAEKLLNNFSFEQNFTFNDLLEFYNIKLHFDNDIFLTKWSKSDKESYNKTTEKTWEILKHRLLKISNQNVDEIFSDLNYNYKNNLWDLINKLSIYKNFSHSTFSNILKKDSYQVNYILQQKNIVLKFNTVIRDFLLTYKNSAEILLSQFEEKKVDKKKIKYYFPKSLSLEDKEYIISTYLDREESNLNYVRLAEKSKSSNELKLSDKTRYKAKKKAEEQNNEILEKGHSWNIRVQGGLSKVQDEPVIFKNENGLIEATYSEKYLDGIENQVDLFKIFSFLFNYTDETSLIYLVSKASELDVMERVMGLKSKNDYEIGASFARKEMLSILQLHLIDNYLRRKDSGIEQLINSFMLHINELIESNNLIFQVRVSNSPELDKIRTLLPDFDFLLKQYKSLTEDGTINIELLQLSSKPIGFSQITSYNKRKYIYSNDNLILRLKHIFFSDQSHMFYTKTFKTKYNNLFDLLTKETVNLDDFANYQIDTIQSLIKDGYLKINTENIVKIDKITFIYIIRELHRNELLNYWHYPKFVRDEIDLLIEDKKMFNENTLLSQEEVKYYNFYLNQKTFTNGYDLRNKYSHGTNTQSEQKHKNDYYLILKIIILTLLKIEDDIIIKKRLLTGVIPNVLAAGATQAH